MTDPERGSALWHLRQSDALLEMAEIIAVTGDPDRARLELDFARLHFDLYEAMRAGVIA